MAKPFQSPAMTTTCRSGSTASKKEGTNRALNEVHIHISAMDVVDVGEVDKGVTELDMRQEHAALGQDLWRESSRMPR